MKIAVELDSPAGNAAGGALAFLNEGSRTLRAAGADCITMADSPRALARGDSATLASLIHASTGMRVIPHMTCRDRNLIGIRSALLALDMAGISEVLIVTGDPARKKECSGETLCTKLHSAELARLIDEWNHEPSLFSRPFTMSAALNVNAVNFTAELRRAEKKAENGITRFFTQPVLSLQALRNISIAKRELGQELYGGILPIVSEKNAAFLAEIIRGISVGGEVLNRYQGIDKEKAAELALEISLGFAKEMWNDVNGLYVITPFKRVDLVSAIVRELRIEEQICSAGCFVKAS